MYEQLAVENLFNLAQTEAEPLLQSVAYPWEALPKIGSFLQALGPTLSKGDYEQREENIWIARSAKIYSNATIAGPAIIGPETEVRPGAFIRGNALVGANCVIGNSTELKNVILFNHVQVPHYNYVGDSILGHKSHMGAGAVTSNVKSDKTLVNVRILSDCIPTGLKKFGAMLGDHVEIGCNSVLNPGTVIGRNTNVYPLSMVRGYIPPNCIYKNHIGEIVEKE